MILKFKEFSESVKYDTYSGPPLQGDSPKVGHVFVPSSGVVGTITNRQHKKSKPIRVDFPEVSLKNRLKNQKRKKSLEIIRRLYSLKGKLK